MMYDWSLSWQTKGKFWKKKYEEVNKIPGKKIGNNNNNHGLRPSRRPLIQGHL